MSTLFSQPGTKKSPPTKFKYPGTISHFMAERIRIDHGTLEAGLRCLPQWKVPLSVKRELLKFLDDLALGKVNRGKRISPQRQVKYLYALRTPLDDWRYWPLIILTLFCYVVLTQGIKTWLIRKGWI